jgi:hypothetical protein
MDEVLSTPVFAESTFLGVFEKILLKALYFWVVALKL